MGLSFRPYLDKKYTGASWSYSGFHHFRELLASSIGLSLDQYQGFTNTERTQPPYQWEWVQSPLKYLLNHSDCDGRLSPAICKQIYPELEKILEHWEPSYDKTAGELLVKQLKRCVKQKKYLIFS